MNRVDTRSKIMVYEVDGEDTVGSHIPELIVESHRRRDTFVVLSLGNDKKVTVVASDLLLAIRRSTG